MASYRLKTILIYASCIFLVLFIIGYALYQAKYLILGPRVTVLTPLNGTHATSSAIDIVGKVFNVSSLSLNGRTILTDEKGNFKEKLLLPEGYTIIELSATDKFGRTITKQLELTRSRSSPIIH